MPGQASDRDDFVQRAAIAIGLAALALVLLYAACFARHALLIICVSVLLAIGFSPLLRATIESAALFAGFTRLFPRRSRRRLVQASEEIATKLSAWLNGQLMLAGTIGASAAVALYWLGVPYVLALIAGIGETIPVVGPLLAAVPAILVAFTVSPRTALWVAIFFLVQQQVENHLLVPKIMERQVGVSPVVVIVALLVGASLLGIVGAILAVATAAILQVVLAELLQEREE